MTRLLRTVVLTAFAVMAGPLSARAASITIAGGSSASFDVYWSQMVGGASLSAVGDFDVTVTNTYVDFDITLTNNTAAKANEAVHSIGFNSDPNGTSLSMLDAGEYFKSFGLDQKFPGYKTVDICAWASNNCTGGAQGANLPGGGAPVGSDTFGFRLMGDFSNGITLSDFVIKFQGDLGSYELSASSIRPTSMPEPSSVVLLLTGAAATFIGARRRRQV
jgi:hypothetical protein